MIHDVAPTTHYAPAGHFRLVICDRHGWPLDTMDFILGNDATAYAEQSATGSEERLFQLYDEFGFCVYEFYRQAGGHV